MQKNENFNEGMTLKLCRVLTLCSFFLREQSCGILSGSGYFVRIRVFCPDSGILSESGYFVRIRVFCPDPGILSVFGCFNSRIWIQNLQKTELFYQYLLTKVYCEIKSNFFSFNILIYTHKPCLQNHFFINKLFLYQTFYCR